MILKSLLTQNSCEPLALSFELPISIRLKLNAHGTKFNLNILFYRLKLIAQCSQLIAFLLPTMMIQNELDAQNLPIYSGNDLGVTYSAAKTIFKVWAPSAQSMTLKLYKSGDATDKIDAFQTFPMQIDETGVWQTEVNEDVKNLFYTVQVMNKNGVVNSEVPDPYAKALGVNGQRGAIVNFNETSVEKIKPSLLKNKTDAILYELHVRDASIAANSGIKTKGKFLGLTELNTVNDAKQSTGLSHLKDLGVTHVHLLPSFDFYTVDEAANQNDPNYRKYNWGYDPLNYFTPEGSYSTDAFSPTTRIIEFKKLVQAFHKQRMRIVMDVVFNHTMFNEQSVFEQIEPGYYHRFTPDGKYSNGAGCGNEVASEKPMVRKYILDCLKHFVNEYDVDGFRFDLMGLHDIESMNLFSKELHAIKPDIILYGEGWTGGTTILPEIERALKNAVPQLDRIAAFSDDMRDAIKGSVFDARDSGFVSGKSGLDESIKFGVVGATQHPQIDYTKVNYSKLPWALEPYQCINYAECHDNHTLWDRLTNSNPTDDEAARIRMFKLAYAIVLTSQGIPFIHAGGEFLRTKGGNENSYNAPDEVNQIDWNRKTEYIEVYDFMKNLIALRRSHPAFRMPSNDLIRQNLEFLDLPSAEKNGPKKIDRLVSYQLKNSANGDSFKHILVIYNGNRRDERIELPKGRWNVVLDGFDFDLNAATLVKGTAFDVPGTSCVILVN